VTVNRVAFNGPVLVREGEAKVGDASVAAAGEEDIIRLDVAVNNAQGVQVLNSRCLNSS
jgi:hypothetical protein